MAAPTVATHIVDSLAAAGVRNLYGVVGDSLNAVTEAVRKHPEMRWIPVRHEESGAFAAGAEAQLDGRLAVCACSSGEVRSALEHAFDTDGPVLVDVLTNPSELSLPPKASLEQARGYSFYLIKEILGGGAGNVLEELGSNVR